KSPTDCVSRGSMTGGSHADARVSTPPRFGGLGLAGVHSGDAGTVLAAGRRPTARAVAPAPVHPTRLRKSRRVTCGRRGAERGVVVAIGLSFHVGTGQTKERISEPGTAGAAPATSGGERPTRRRLRQDAGSWRPANRAAICAPTVFALCRSASSASLAIGWSITTNG